MHNGKMGCPWWGEMNLEKSGCGGNEQKSEKGWKWVKLGENPKLPFPRCGRCIKTYSQTTMMPLVSQSISLWYSQAHCAKCAPSDNTATYSPAPQDIRNPPPSRDERQTVTQGTNKRVRDPLPISSPKTLQQYPQLQAPIWSQGVGVGENKWGLASQMNTELHGSQRGPHAHT